ncbi:DoxX family protein [Streptomyces himalayensis]|uniref:DoxX family protein n=1 Tax=Streptomyces himalayensis subsp. himalayensis TaxID=2756131 RepID=A0A7W0DPA2_9ACTN|nr:DoxX family protein [Streptomyces himalayensis]MBA2948253.1 DoxX family protein [Streptomyces himalayensis subsp. himalayensis]
MSETTTPATSETTASDGATSATGNDAARPRGRRLHLALLTLQVLLALFFAFASALPKLIAHPSAAESFDKLGWGAGGMYTIGALELAGAIALLIPVLSSVASVAFVALMIGAFITQIVAFDGQYAATPVIFIVPFALIAWARRRHNADLLRLITRRARA